MLQNKLNGYKVILASQSPRRQELVKHLDIPFEVVIKEDIKEVYPDDLEKISVPLYLARLKASPYQADIKNNRWIVVTADTIVLCEDEILGKPRDREDAMRMLSLLSGKAHEVITGVCLSSSNRQKVFAVSTKVFFKELTQDEITYYVDTYQPFDKAGAYGIQEWIGMVGIDRIEGSYFNVVGLPVQALYNELLKFLN